MLSREKTIDTFKVKIRIQIEQKQIMLNLKEKAQSADTLKENMQILNKMMVQPYRVKDQLFEETGVEDDQLIVSVKKLDLEKDPEFQLLADEYMKAVMQTPNAC